MPSVTLADLTVKTSSGAAAIHGIRHRLCRIGCRNGSGTVIGPILAWRVNCVGIILKLCGGRHAGLGALESPATMVKASSSLATMTLLVITSGRDLIKRH